MYLNTRDLYKEMVEFQDRKKEAEGLTDQIAEIHEEIIDLQKELGDEMDVNLTGSVVDRLVAKIEERRNDMMELVKEREEVELYGDEQEELDELEQLECQVEGFVHGVMLADEDGFHEYCRDYVQDSGIPDFAINWIDWDRVYHDMSTDYTVVEYQGEEYYVL